MKCPNCGGEDCERVEVDVGVGTQCGPWGCPDCGWAEDEDDTLPVVPEETEWDDEFN